MPPVRPLQNLDVVFPRVTVSDLELFAAVFDAWLHKQRFHEKLEEYGSSEKHWRDISDRLAADLGCASGVELREKCRARGGGSAARAPATVFYQGLGALLRDLKKLARDARGRSRRVVVEGSEFGIGWLLPRVLARSKWLERHPDNELEIRQSKWKQYLGALERGEADLCLGTRCPHSVGVDAELALPLERWLIYPKQGAWQPPREGVKSLDVLRKATVFLLAAEEVSPSLARINRLVPPAEPPGRRIHVQTVALLYLYARQGLGAGIGYHPYFGISDAKASPLAAAPILDRRVEPAQITLYRRAGEELPEAAASLRQAIVEVCKRIQEEIAKKQQ